MADGYNGDVKIGLEFDPKKVREVAKTLEQQIGRVFKSAYSDKLNSKLEGILSTMSKLHSKSQTLQQQLGKLEKTQVPTAAYTEISKRLEKMNGQFDKLLIKQDEMREMGKTSGAAWEKLDLQIERLGQHIRDDEAELQQLVSTGKAFQLGSTTDEYSKLAHDLDTVNNQLIVYKAKYNEAADAAVRSGQRMQGAVREVSESVEQGTQQAVGSLTTVKETLSLIPSILKKGTTGIARTLPKVFQNVADNALGAASAIGSLGSKLVQFVGPTIKRGLQSLVGSLKQITHHGAKSGLTFNKILRYGFGIRSLYALVNKLRNAIKEGVTNLAQFNGGANQTNAAISSMVSSLNYLKNSFGAAFAPILTVVAPILSQFIDMLAAAINRIGMFFAALTGAKSFIGAKKTSTNYAASKAGGGGSKGKSAEEKYQAALAKAQEKYEKELAKTEEKRAKAQEKYAKALEEVNEALGEYDKLSVIATKDAPELEIFEDPEMEQVNMEDFLDAGGAGAAVEDMFEEIPIDDIISDWADKFKEAWKNADFTEIGNILGTKLKNALDSIDWSWIKDFAWRLASSIATFINGFIETEGLADSIGKTIGEAINTAFLFLNTFVRTLHWTSIGQFIGQALQTSIQTINWPSIGTFLATGINGIFDLIGGIAEKWDGAEFGKSLATSLNVAVASIRWEKNSQSISAMVHDLITSISSFITSVSWQEVGSAISRAFRAIQWRMLFKDATTLAASIIKAIVDLIVGFLDSGTADSNFLTVGEEIRNGIIDGLIEAFGTENPMDLAMAVIDMLVRMVDIMRTLIPNVQIPMWDVLKGMWDWVMTCWKVQSEEDGEQVIEGLKEGFIKSLWDITPWTFKVIFKPVWDAVRKHFGIASPSKVFRELGNMLIEGMKLGLQERVQGVIDKFTDMKTKILAVFNSLRTTVITVWNNIWSGIKGVINKILGGVERFLNGIIGAINALINALNSIQLDVPDWMTEAIETLAGVHVESIGFNVPTLSYVSVPRLAEGAVIPPNKQFLAMLGDQKSGTNIEAPLDTMVEAFKTALQQEGSSNKEPIVLQLDGRTVAEVVWDEQDKRYRQLGKYIPSYS